MQSQKIQLRFPAGGVVKRMSYQSQSPYTTAAASNVWPDDATAERERGGVRPGIEKAYPTGLGDSLDLIADVAYAQSDIEAINNLIQQYLDEEITLEELVEALQDLFSNPVGYETKVVTAAGGEVYYWDGAAWQQAEDYPSSFPCHVTEGEPLGYADLMGKLYITGTTLTLFADMTLNGILFPAGTEFGGRIGVFNPSDNTLTSLGIPFDNVPTDCTLLCVYNNRLFAAGSKREPQNFFACRQGEPGDWDYSKDDDQAAFAANLSEQGRIGEPITALIPHTGCLIFGCMSSLWVMYGDPTAGGSLKMLANNVGVVDKNAWCFDTKGYLYLLSPDGLYCMPPGCGGAPQSISKERLPQELLYINRETHRVSMSYDTRYRGLFLTVTAIESGEMVAYWIDTSLAQSGDAGGSAVSFWPVSFDEDGHQPFILYSLRDGVFTSEGPSSMLMGGRDGYVRRFNRTATTDDGTAIVAEVEYGPFPLSSPGREGLLQSIQVALGSGSGKVQCEARSGKSAEQAYDRPSLAYKTFARPGINPIFLPRLRGRSGVIRFVNVGGSRFILEDVVVERLDAGSARV